MRDKIRHLSARVKQILFFALAIILAFVFSIFLLPFVLVLVLASVLSTWILIAQGKKKNHQEIEIFPSEESTYKSTSDRDLEIKIETLQRKAGKEIEPKDNSDDS
jgi:hypothetical protein